MDFQPTNLPIESKYPKLVRDRIPEIIRNKTGAEVTQRILENDGEFLEYLLKKLAEEAAEAEYGIKHGNLEEELADVFEIIDAILEIKGWNKDYIAKIQEEKRRKNGGFKTRILMISK